ncbi:MAG: ATP-binding cassette domain-containing protein [Chloroflexota bacterium]|nr:ATP-binding cassette domain-containing protein [Chloroflexota bacterium]
MTPLIEVEDLVKRYRDASTNAVDGVSFAVRAGEFFALLGPNGAGKTTTISILTTTLGPSGGSARIAGHDVQREASLVRRDVGIIFQKPSLDQNLTGEENIRLHAILYGVHPWRPTFRLMPTAYRSRVEELAALLGLGAEVFRPVRTYSGGMRRKLEIVRSLLHQPKVLFLDEPTSGLDVPSRRTLWQYLADVRRASGTTIFLTTHYIEEAEEADAICIMDRGKVVSLGTPEGTSRSPTCRRTFPAWRTPTSRSWGRATRDRSRRRPGHRAARPHQAPARSAAGPHRRPHARRRLRAARRNAQRQLRARDRIRLPRLRPHRDLRPVAVAIGDDGDDLPAR